MKKLSNLLPGSAQLMALTILVVVIALITLMTLGGCSENPASPELSGLEKNVPEGQSSMVVEDGVTWYEGVIGGTNQYAFLVPDDWNGELVLYAHGFVDAAEPLTLPDKDNVEAIRDEVVDRGFAWAYCSYRENGLAIKDGAWATRKMKNLFVAQVQAEPSYNWIMAQSLGGLIGVELVETHPNEFDGLLTMAGMIGGTSAQLDYVGNIRVLFDLLYPGVLPGTVIDMPTDLDIMMDVVYPAIGAIQADPTGLGLMSQIDQTPLPFTNADQLGESLVTALGFHARGIHDILDRTKGRCPIDNMDTEYSSASGMVPPEYLLMINGMIPRYDRDLPTENFFAKHYEPSGELTVPMVSLHNRWDPVVPLFNEEVYGDKVGAAGYGINLEQQVLDRYGHTNYSADEAADALMLLRSKVVGVAF